MRIFHTGDPVSVAIVLSSITWGGLYLEGISVPCSDINAKCVTESVSLKANGGIRGVYFSLCMCAYLHVVGCLLTAAPVTPGRPAIIEWHMTSVVSHLAAGPGSFILVQLKWIQKRTLSDLGSVHVLCTFGSSKYKESLKTAVNSWLYAIIYNQQL